MLFFIQGIKKIIGGEEHTTPCNTLVYSSGLYF